jgi:hypothetical protein
MLRADAPHFKQFGEIYFSAVNPGAIKAWHIHKEMSLNYAAVVGTIKLVLYDDRPDSPTRGELMELFIGEQNYSLVTVPPMVWNGFKGCGSRAGDRGQLRHASAPSGRNHARGPVHDEDPVRLAAAARLTLVDRPDVTFVIPNYNGAEYLRQTIESLLAQRDRRFLAILADNCSTDASIEIARSYRDERLSVQAADRPRVDVGELEPRRGYVTTPYFVLAHSDEPLRARLPVGAAADAAGSPQRLRCALHGWRTSTNRGRCSICRSTSTRRTSTPDEDPYCRQPCDEAAWLRDRGITSSRPRRCTGTDLFRKIGPFNTRFQFVPDWEYWLRGVFVRDIQVTRDPAEAGEVSAATA